VNTVCCRTSLWPEETTERLMIPERTQQVGLAVTPVLQLLRVGGRYVLGRRNQHLVNQGLLSFIVMNGSIGTPSAFSNVDVAAIEFYGPTGECWIPSDLLFYAWNEVEVTYIGGYTQIPDRAKLAMAEIVNSICARGVSNRMSYSVGKMSQSFSEDGFVTKTARDLLSPFIVRSLA